MAFIRRYIWLLKSFKFKDRSYHPCTLFGCIFILITFVYVALNDVKFHRVQFIRVIKQNIGITVGYELPIYIEKQLDKVGTTCDPYVHDYTQFNVSIDGELYPKNIPLYHDKRINFNCLNSTKKRNRILLWNRFWRTPDYYYGIGNGKPFLGNRCPVTNCELTNNRVLANESDLIVVHSMEELNELPQWKFSYQKWVFYEYESPLHTIDLSIFNNVFNMSSTYRADSNTTSLYFAESSYYWTFNAHFNEYQDFLSSKDRFSAIIVSNCNDKMNRLGYMKELQKYIPVTVYGRCGRECPYDCHKLIGNKYKFYFAFENSFCRDYITEKFFGILKYDIIPVVLGGGKYDLFIPKSGYISASDFDTPKELANYLLYLSNNHTAYNAYFKWKKYVVFDSFNPYLGHICELCILLNMDAYKKDGGTHVIEDMNNYWHPSYDCMKPDYKYNSFKFTKFSYQEGNKWRKHAI